MQERLGGSVHEPGDLAWPQTADGRRRGSRPSDHPGPGWEPVVAAHPISLGCWWSSTKKGRTRSRYSTTSRLSAVGRKRDAASSRSETATYETRFIKNTVPSRMYRFRGVETVFRHFNCRSSGSRLGWPHVSWIRSARWSKNHCAWARYAVTAPGFQRSPWRKGVMPGSRAAWTAINGA